MSHSLALLRKLKQEDFDEARLKTPSYTQEEVSKAATDGSTDEELKTELTNRFNSVNKSLLKQAENVLNALKTQLSSHETPVLENTSHETRSTDFFQEMENPKNSLPRTVYDHFVSILVGSFSAFSIIAAWNGIAIYLIDAGEFEAFYEDPSKAYMFATPGIIIAFALKAIATIYYKNDAERHIYIRRLSKTTLIFVGIWLVTFSYFFGVKHELWQEHGVISGTVLEPVLGFVFTFTQMASEVLTGAIVWIWWEKIISKNKVVLPVKNPARLEQDEKVDLQLCDLLERQSIAGHISGFLDAAAAKREAFIQVELRNVRDAREKVALAASAAKLNAAEKLKAEVFDRHSSNVSLFPGNH